MKIYAITSHNKIPGPTGYRNTWAFRAFFHGNCGGQVNRYGEHPYEELEITRNIRLMPEIFFPRLPMVVNEAIAARLRVLPNVDLNPCRWAGVFEYPVDEQHINELMTRFSVLPDGFEEWLRERVHPPTAEVQRIRYSEVIAPMVENLANECAHQTKIELPRPLYKRKMEFVTCADVHRKYPIVEATPYYLLTELAFKVIEPFLQGEAAMFRVHSFEIID